MNKVYIKELIEKINEAVESSEYEVLLGKNNKNIYLIDLQSDSYTYFSKDSDLLELVKWVIQNSFNSSEEEFFKGNGDGEDWSNIETLLCLRGYIDKKLYFLSLEHGLKKGIITLD